MNNDNGFTLVELLVVVSIIALLFVFFFLGMRTQVRRGQDARRKTDLAKLEKAFEEYTNDRRCYPAANILSTCGSAVLSPYLPSVPCDPVHTTEPYLYVPGEPSRCGGYRICAKLEDKNDPDITRLGCDPDNGCGFGAGYNYCVSMGYAVTPEGFDPNVPPTPTPGGGGGGATSTPTPTPPGGGGATSTPTSTPTPTPQGGGGTPTPTPSYAGSYACTPGGDCDLYDNPAAHGCPQSWAESNCQNQCTDPAKRCAN